MERKIKEETVKELGIMDDVTDDDMNTVRCNREYVALFTRYKSV